MNSSIDLNTASREVLLAIIVQPQALLQDQQAIIAQLQRRIETLEGNAKPGGPKGMPGIKPKSAVSGLPGSKATGSPALTALPVGA